MKAIKHSCWSLVIVLLGSAAYLPLQASAEEAKPQGVIPTSEIFGSAAVDTQSLAISRGGAELNLYDIKSDGLVSNNQASNLTTGSNWVTEGSFAGASGFSTVVQNSGNNVLIQNATIINLRVQ